MARPRNEPKDAAATPDEADAPQVTPEEAAEGVPSPEAEAAAEAVAAEAAAETRRQAELERAAARKTYPDDALPPTERMSGDGVVKFSRDRLIAESYALVGVAPHVVVGALHGNPAQFLSVDEVKAEIAEWTEKEVV